ncbi:MerR family transcriptional regulator [Actinosynnema sp. NPDC020468]|uniref:MerR family transcriptional regulator n=1 Tax=Actinosynnema sp. NPDC020468 TaxID=3154488 RepID=UPI0033D4D914
MLWSPGAVARMLGISPTTLRTWDRRYGLGPSTRQEGKHRRYTAADVARLRRMLDLTGEGVAPAAAAAVAMGAEPPPSPRSGGGRRAVAVEGGSARGFARAASRLDLTLMTSLATRLIEEHGVVGAWNDVLMPFLVALGDRVTAQGSGVEVEHLATSSIVGVLRGRAVPGFSGRLPALLACAPEEQHSLPLDVLAAALGEHGCATRNLGARVPARALLDAVMLLAPRCVVVWAHSADLAALVPVADLLERGCTVLVAGPGWPAAPPGSRFLGSLNEALATVLELNRF